MKDDGDWLAGDGRNKREGAKGTISADGRKAILDVAWLIQVVNSCTFRKAETWKENKESTGEDVISEDIVRRVAEDIRKDIISEGRTVRIPA